MDCTKSKWWFRIELGKWNYFVCYFGDFFLISLRHLPNSIQNSSITEDRHNSSAMQTTMDCTKTGWQFRIEVFVERHRIFVFGARIVDLDVPPKCVWAVQRNVSAGHSRNLGTFWRNLQTRSKARHTLAKKEIDSWGCMLIIYFQ